MEVHLHDGGPRRPGEVGDLGGGLDLRARAAHEQRSDLPHERLGRLERRRGDSLAEQDDVRLHEGPAARAGRGPARHLAARHHQLAAQAPEAVCAPVELHDLLTPGGLVEPVDVLGDDAREEAASLQRRQGEVPGVWGGGGQLLLQLCEHGPDLPRVALEARQGGVLLRVVAGPEPARAAEVGDTALGGHAGTRERDDPAAGHQGRDLRQRRRLGFASLTHHVAHSPCLALPP